MEKVQVRAVVTGIEQEKVIQSHLIGFSAIRARAFPGPNTPVPLAPGRAFPSGQILWEFGLQSEYHRNEFFGSLVFGEASVIMIKWQKVFLTDKVTSGRSSR
jgi:hypothetical protein